MVDTGSAEQDVVFISDPMRPRSEEEGPPATAIVAAA